MPTARLCLLTAMLVTSSLAATVPLDLDETPSNGLYSASESVLDHSHIRNDLSLSPADRRQTGGMRYKVAQQSGAPRRTKPQIYNGSPQALCVPSTPACLRCKQARLPEPPELRAYRVRSVAVPDQDMMDYLSQNACPLARVQIN